MREIRFCAEAWICLSMEFGASGVALLGFGVGGARIRKEMNWRCWQVLYYANRIFERAGLGFEAAVAVGLFKFVMTLVSVNLVNPKLRNPDAEPSARTLNPGSQNWHAPRLHQPLEPQTPELESCGAPNSGT